jgi:hypothetical protein
MVDFPASVISLKTLFFLILLLLQTATLAESINEMSLHCDRHHVLTNTARASMANSNHKIKSKQQLYDSLRVDEFWTYIGNKKNHYCPVNILRGRQKIRADYR